MEDERRGVFERPELPVSVLPPRCAQTLAELRAMSDAEALAALGDPRGIHRALYHDLAPPDHPEWAGNYRGSNHPSLRDLIVAFSFNDAEGTTEIVGPHKVPESMEKYAALLGALDLRATPTFMRKLGLVAGVMSLFGLIHPFIDGNGHVQRITAQCLMERAGLRMAPAWSVHPCPYGEEVHRALAACRHDDLVATLAGFVEPGPAAL